MAMPQYCFLAKGAKRPSHATITIKFDRIPFDPCNSIKGFDLSFRPEKFDLFTATRDKGKRKRLIDLDTPNSIRPAINDEEKS